MARFVDPKLGQLPRDGFKDDTPITWDAVEGRLKGKPWPKAEDSAKAQELMDAIRSGKLECSGEDIALLREFFDSQLVVMAMLQGLARHLHDARELP